MGLAAAFCLLGSLASIPVTTDAGLGQAKMLFLEGHRVAYSWLCPLHEPVNPCSLVSISVLPSGLWGAVLWESCEVWSLPRDQPLHLSLATAAFDFVNQWWEVGVVRRTGHGGRHWGPSG